MTVSNFEATASLVFLFAICVALLIGFVIANHKAEKHNAELREIVKNNPRIIMLWNSAENAKEELQKCRARKAELKVIIDELQYCPLENSKCGKKLVAMKHEFLNECLNEKRSKNMLEQCTVAIHDFEVKYCGEQKDICWKDFFS